MELCKRRRHIIYPEGHSAVLDITKPPFNAIPDGKSDCTKALQKAFDFVTGEYLKAYNQTLELLQKQADDDAMLSFEVRKIGGKMNVPFPLELPKGYIIYLPKGEYLVTDTITYSHENLFDMLGNLRWLEMCAMIRVIGEAEEETIIRLSDNLSTFAFGARRPVVNFCNGEKSGVAMSNSIQNLTIDIGENNPGAVALRFLCNNTGLISDINIKSSDKLHRGYAGVEIIDEKISCGYMKNVRINGFDYAVRMMSQQHNMAMEHIFIQNQRIAGIYQLGSALSVRDLKSHNTVKAVHLLGYSAHLTMVDSEFCGNNAEDCAIKAEFGHYYFRNIKIKGYGSDLSAMNLHFDKEQMPYECFSENEYTLFEAPKPEFFDTSSLPEEPYFDEDKRNFISVKNFGAMGDGFTDDTEAIQCAVNSGAKGILFEAGCYLITSPIIIPEHVCNIDFMFCDLRIGKELANNEEEAVFVIQGDDKPISICNLLAWEQFHGRMTLLNHAGKRTLIMEFLHTQGAALYKNSISGGTVFINSCACTIGGVPGSGGRERSLKHEQDFIYARDIPCFFFRGQTVYARQINPERSINEIINDGGKLFVLGFKTEEEGTAFETRNHGITQVLGGMCCIGADKEIPLIKNIDSHSHIVFSTMINSERQKFPIAVWEQRENNVLCLRDSDLPIRAMISYYMPKYSS